jgi:small subunit ribosomal protein S6
VVQEVQPWGRRRLAYPIARYRDGVYVLSRLQLRPETTVEIERALKLTESVIRHLLVRADKLAPAATAA